LIDKSEKMLEIVLDKNTEEMCNTLQISPIKIINSRNKTDYCNLKHIIYFVYFNAKITFDINKEKEGKNNIDFIFYPKNNDYYHSIKNE